jgi:hypothetical protein
MMSVARNLTAGSATEFVRQDQASPGVTAATYNSAALGECLAHLRNKSKAIAPAPAREAA